MLGGKATKINTLNCIRLLIVTRSCVLRSLMPDPIFFLSKINIQVKGHIYVYLFHICLSMSYLSVSIIYACLCHICLSISNLFDNVISVCLCHICLSRSCLSDNVISVYQCHLCLLMSFSVISVCFYHMPVFVISVCLCHNCLSLTTSVCLCHFCLPIS